MGVDYFTCAICGYNFPDCGEFVSCDCGEHFCSWDCGRTDYTIYNEKGEPTEEDGDKCTCVICRKEDANNDILFEALLKHFNLTREQALEIWEKQ